MEKNQKIARFPTTRREHTRLFLRSRDGRLRLIGVLRGITGWLLLLSIVLFLAAYHRLLAPENLRRVSNYLQLGLSAEAEDIATIPFASSSYLDAELFGGGLAVADSDGLYVARPGGISLQPLQLGYSRINLSAAGNYVLAYDRGSSGITLTNGVSPLTLDWGEDKLSSPIINASITQSGAFALVTDESGYKTAVRVFNKDRQLAYKWLTSEYYVQSAAVSPDGRHMAALAFHQNDTVLEGKLLMFDLSRQEVAAECVLGSNLGLEVRFLNNTVAAAVSDTGLSLVNVKGKQVHTIGYPVGDLLGFAFEEGSVILAQRSYTKSARTEIISVSANGTETGPLYTNEGLVSLSVAGGRLAVLTTTGLHVYNAKLEPLWTDASAAGGLRVLLKTDGTACILFGKEARLLHETQSEESIHDNNTDNAGNP